MGTLIGIIILAAAVLALLDTLAWVINGRKP
jgi:hypothetical protein